MRLQNVTSTDLVLHMYDNANADPPFSGVNQTLELNFYLGLEAKTSTNLKDLHIPDQTLYVDSQGAFNPLPGGNVLIGYGKLPIVSEYGPDGDVPMTMQFGSLNRPQASYRS